MPAHARMAALIEDEGLSWARAAEILRAIELDFGWLTGPVNEHVLSTYEPREGPDRRLNAELSVILDASR